MTRDEYEDIKLPEATITFHRDDQAGDTYVTVIWDRPTHTQARGFKFIVLTEYMDRIMPTGRLADEQRALAELAAHVWKAGGE